MTRFVVNVAGTPVEYASRAEVQKAIRRVPICHYLELEKQGGVNLDALDAGVLPAVVILAAWTFLLRRGAGDDVTWQTVIDETSVDDIVIPGPDDDDEPEPVEPPDPPQSGHEGPSKT